MSIVKVNPFLPGKSFTNIVDDLFNRSISDVVGGDYVVTNPSANITEHADNFTLDIAAPGLQKADFNIAVEDNQLIVSAEKQSKTEEKDNGKWTRKEFNFHSFKRSFQLSDAVKVEEISAEYKNGILSIVLPKREEVKAKALKKIDIK